MTSSRRAMTLPNMIALGMLLISALALVGFVVVSNANNAAEKKQLASTAQVVRDNSHRLSTPTEAKAVLVEFLDFECEACAAAYPLVEDLQAEYGDQVSFVSRYFPLPGHPNSMTAAIAVEAAAQQGEYEAMYHRLFETQARWSHTDESQAGTFRGYARDLGLDMEAYDQTVADPATAARVLLDKNDGIGLGVQGTPTFFLDGELIQPATEEEFRQLIQTAIAK